ncbi:hypothetical protein V4V36_26235 [Paenibacillus lautus]|nr:hypothetical protein [Paenibacillus lautus]VTR25996.1 Uncharacterised protein [Actinobacillus pleuropneumoniae]
MKQAQTAESVGFKPPLLCKGRRKDEAASAGNGVDMVPETTTI